MQRGRRYLPVRDEEGRLGFQGSPAGLAERAGVKLEAYKAEKPEEKEAHERLRGLLEEAVTFYRYHLSTPAGKFALDYIHEKRHLSDATIETFGLGYAPRAGMPPSNISAPKATPKRNCWMPASSLSTKGKAKRVHRSAGVRSTASATA